MRTVFIVLACLPLAFTACAVSKNPLSDPKEAKPDPRLIGVWRLKGSDIYYHVGRAGGKLPEGMIVLIGATSTKRFCWLLALRKRCHGPARGAWGESERMSCRFSSQGTRCWAALN